MANEQWHLSKSVPISFLFGLMVQTATIIWFIAGLNSSVETNTREIDRHEVRLQNLEAIVQTQAVAIARMDENIQAIREMLQDLSERR